MARRAGSGGGRRVSSVDRAALRCPGGGRADEAGACRGDRAASVVAHDVPARCARSAAVRARRGRGRDRLVGGRVADAGRGRRTRVPLARRTDAIRAAAFRPARGAAPARLPAQGGAGWRRAAGRRPPYRLRCVVAAGRIARHRRCLPCAARGPGDRLERDAGLARRVRARPTRRVDAAAGCKAARILARATRRRAAGAGFADRLHAAGRARRRRRDRGAHAAGRARRTARGRRRPARRVAVHDAVGRVADPAVALQSATRIRDRHADGGARCRRVRIDRRLSRQYGRAARMRARRRAVRRPARARRADDARRPRAQGAAVARGDRARGREPQPEPHAAVPGDVRVPQRAAGRRSRAGGTGAHRAARRRRGQVRLESRDRLSR